MQKLRSPIPMIAGTLGLALISSLAVAAEPTALRQRGEQLYRDQCAACHGDQGQGVEGEYDDPLVGDASVGELAATIDFTMPLDDPEACVGEDAEAVAAYVHYAFYSEAARIRNRPPQIELARLTGTQLRQSLADLYARFDGVLEPVEEHGLKGIYFDGERWKKENKKLERVDPVLDFDFGKEAPVEGVKPEAFYIHWSGGLKVDETGDYQIIVRSSCSFVMDFGADDRELINNHVQSGDKTEFRRKLRLTGGRVYPVKIQFVQRERKTEQPPARISLSWVPPHGQEEIVPARNLVPVHGPGVFALQTKMPPDDSSYGYERGIAVNRQWDQATTAAAIEFAEIATEELWPRYQRRHGKEKDDKENDGKEKDDKEKEESGKDRPVLRKFLTELVETAFRGQLTDELRQMYVDDQVDAEPDNAEAIRRTLLVALKSPRFLYPTLDPQHSPSQRVANRLALTLYDSLPTDRWLTEAARSGELKTDEQVRQAAERMVDDYRARSKVRQMLYGWLDIDHLGEISKDSERFPGFDPAVVSDLRKSFVAMLDEIVWSEPSDFRQLLQAEWTYTTDRLAEYYGESWQPAEDEGPRLRRSRGGAKHRYGVLTHPYLMSGLAYTDATSPIHRGVFLIRHVLGRTLRPPNDAFSPLSPDLHPDLTTRERVELQTSPESCQICHSKINGVGFTLENFDAVGRYRSEEKEKPIDASGGYTTRSGEEVTFDGPGDLADFLVTSDDAHRAFVSHAFEFFVKQPIAAYGPDTLDRLTASFRESGFHIRKLLAEIAVIAATEPIASHEKET